MHRKKISFIAWFRTRETSALGTTPTQNQLYFTSLHTLYYTILYYTLLCTILYIDMIVSSSSSVILDLSVGYFPAVGMYRWDLPFNAHSKRQGREILLGRNNVRWFVIAFPRGIDRIKNQLVCDENQTHAVGVAPTDNETISQRFFHFIEINGCSYSYKSMFHRFCDTHVTKLSNKQLSTTERLNKARNNIAKLTQKLILFLCSLKPTTFLILLVFLKCKSL